MRRLLLLFVLTAGGLLLVATPAFAPCHSITFANEPYSVAENAGKVTITVTNGGGAQQSDQTVDYKTVNGTAKAGADYVAKSGTVLFGKATKNSELSFDIVIKDNKIHESTEKFTVQLSNLNPPNACPGFQPSIDEPSATVTITDNDAILKTSTPTPTPTHTPTKSSPKATPTPTPTKSPSPSPSATPTPTPTPTQSTVAAAPDEGGGGLSGGAVAGIVIGALAVGGAAAVFVRRRFLT